MTAPRDTATRCWTLHSADRELDVEVTAPDDGRLADVLPPLAELLGTPEVRLWAGSSLLDPGVSLTAAELGHGAVLGVGRPGPRTGEAERSSALELHVVGGPDAGRTVALGHGDHVIGRGAEAQAVLTDPDVSRRHVLIHVGTAGITVADLGSTNGASVDGEPVTAEPRPWSAGPVLRLGNSGLTITGPSGYPLPTRPAAGGRRVVQHTTRVTHPPPPVEIRLPRPPDQPARRRLAWLAVGLPVIGGVLLAVLLRTPHFLFFALLGPAAALGTWASERWSGRRSRRQEEARYRAALRETGRRRAAAVHEYARHRDAAHPNLATLTGAARRRAHVLWSRRGSDSDALTVRLGTGPGETSVVEIGPGGSRDPVPGTDLPVVLDLRVAGGLGVVGPRPLGLGILAAVLAQLIVLHAPGEVDLLLLVAEERLRDWAWARWLPHLPASAVRVDRDEPAGENRLHARLEQVIRRRRRPATDGAAGRSPEQPGWLVVVVDRPLETRAAGLLREARALGVITLTLAGTVADLPAPVDALLTARGETGDHAILTRHAISGGTGMVVDRLPAAVAARLARDLAPLRPARSGGELPQFVRLLDLPSEGLRLGDGEPTGSWCHDRGRLVASLGHAADGPVEVDLCRSGPHALVAGTTGSGKSEFLQTLIAGLALNHPPDRCSFLLLDYKGGAAFAEAAALPHTVGVLTDLDGRTTERALRSLTAELLRREKVLAEHRVTDLAVLPGVVPLARLVIVVDEFAALAEEHPSFVPGLVGIAQRGRSLGVHLVLATQRPSGVVSPEIRANAALRVCLRTTDEADSRDVLGTPLAAHLPVDRPGRAYLRSGAGTPALFQVARVAGEAEPDCDGGPQVHPWLWPLEPIATARHTGRGESDLTRISRALRRHSARRRIVAPHRPWQPPLPRRLDDEELREARAALSRGRRASAATQPHRLVIGLVDKPAEQTWDLLALDLASDGAWLAVGSARSGRTTFLRTVLGEAVRRLPPAELHVHVLDQGGGALAREAAGLPHAGTTVSGDDPLRSIRLLSRLADEIADRRSTGRTTPRLLLLVDGVESLMEQLDESDAGSGSGAFLRLVRDGAAAGLTCLMTADRAVPGGRLASAVDRRLVLPLADMADYVVAGVSASAVPAERPPGRALLGEDGWECQVALPAPFDVRDAESPATSAALRIPPLPERPVILLPDRTTLAADPAGALRLPLGPGGDEGRPLEVDLARTGGLLIAGPPGSGRSTALAALATHLGHGDASVAHLVAAHCRKQASEGTVTLDPADEEGFRSWLAALGGRPGALVADDVGLLADAPVLSRMPPPGSADPVVLLAAGTAADLTRSYHGPVAALRRRRAGLVLCPGPGDGEPFGIRLPRIPLPRRPGSGWLVTGDGVQRVQVARRERRSPGVAVTGRPP